MTRDHGLFALAGILAGFIAGYMLHEVMAARQPPRLPAGQNPALAARQMPPTGGAAPGMSSSAPAGEAQMEQIRQLGEYVKQNPDDVDAALALANLAFDAQIWPRAAELYQRYLTAHPDDPDVLTDVGVCLREMGQPDDALASFRRAADAHPDHWQSRFNEVVVLTFDLARYDEARSTLEQLRAMQPGNDAVERLSSELERLAAGGSPS